MQKFGTPSIREKRLKERSKYSDSSKSYHPAKGVRHWTPFSFGAPCTEVLSMIKF